MIRELSVVLLYHKYVYVLISPEQDDLHFPEIQIIFFVPIPSHK